MKSEIVKSIEFDPSKLKEAIERSGMSQSEVSRLVGDKHRNVLNKVVHGKRTPTATELLRYAEVLNESPSSFAKVA